VVGLFIGFVLGVYLAERLRLGANGRAWTSTKTALRVAGLSAVIELVTGLAMAIIWLIAALTTG
jgi:uncharacterized protein